MASKEPIPQPRMPSGFAKDEGLKKGLRRLAIVYGETNAVLDAQRAQHQVTCEKGCAHCCYQLQTATVAEVVGMLLYLLSTVQGELFFRARSEKLREYCIRLVQKDASTGKWWEEQRPCLFLDTSVNLCTVHPMRPMTCRTYLAVTDPKHCAPESDGLVSTLNFREVHHLVDKALARAAMSMGTDARGHHPLPYATYLAMTFLNEGEVGLKRALAKFKGAIPIDMPELFWFRLELFEGQRSFRRRGDGLVQCAMCKSMTPEADFDANGMQCGQCGLPHSDEPFDPAKMAVARMAADG